MADQPEGAPTARDVLDLAYRCGPTGPATDEELRRVEEDTRRDVAESGRAAGVGAQMIAVHAAPAVRRALYEHGRTAPAPGREERGEASGLVEELEALAAIWKDKADDRAGSADRTGYDDGYSVAMEDCADGLRDTLARHRTSPRAEAPTVEQTFRVERVADDNGNISVRATVASQRTITRSPPRAEAPAAGAGLTVERPPFGYVVHYGGGRWKMTVLNRQDAEEEAECSPGAEAVPLYRHAAPTPGAGLTVAIPPVDVAARLAEAVADDAQALWPKSRDRRVAGLTVALRRALTSLGAPAGTGGGRGEAWGQETRRLLLVALMAAFFDGSQVGADPCTRDAAEAALLRHLGITPSPPTPPPVGEGEGVE